ncbi:MAG: thermonuclease family protein [Akkermansiaceae bacterium]
MAATNKQTVLKTLVVLIVVISFLWSRYQGVGVGRERGSAGFAEDHGETAVHASEGELSLSRVRLDSAHYEVWDDCIMLDHRGNDGDSFHIQAPHGREEIRLYYVDAPESAARTYRDGNTNFKRIAQQGAALGDLDRAETTSLGMAAKAFVKELLDGKRFKVVTRGERVYGSHRKYAFVVVDWERQLHYLHELIVLQGLGRIHTKPAQLPDNTTVSEQKNHLYKLQAYAKNMRYGAWGLSVN